MSENGADHTSRLACLRNGIPWDPLPPEFTKRNRSVPHTPRASPNLSVTDAKLALRNALRYVPEHLHSEMGPELARELATYGHIYMYRLEPGNCGHPRLFDAAPLDQYPAECLGAAAIMLMICNNLSPEVAQFPHELVTYGGNGQVFSNWAQFWLTMQYLATMTTRQTLSLYSGHPMGLFPSCETAPRAIITNGMMVPVFSRTEDYGRLFSMGITQYGQMTAGSFCYIGPQGIVHGTTLTLLGAARLHFRHHDRTSGGAATAAAGEVTAPKDGQEQRLMTGKVFLSSGLGGMSGAQAKAAVICGCIGVIAEVDRAALVKRHRQGWLMEIVDKSDDVVRRIRECRASGTATSIGFHGNVVHLWERMVLEHRQTGEALIDIGSDQTSCHNVYAGGYYPVGTSVEMARRLIQENPTAFREMVQTSLKRHVAAVDYMVRKTNMYFFDYGNAFLLEAAKAGADLDWDGGSQFRWPSYVQDIMGKLFSMGFGPFRWVCTSGDPADLATTDRLAAEVIDRLLATECPLDHPALLHPSRSSSSLRASRSSEALALAARGGGEAATEGTGEGGGDTLPVPGQTSPARPSSPAPPAATTHASRAYVRGRRQQYLDNLHWIREAGKHKLVVNIQARILYSDQLGRIELAKAFNAAVANGELHGPVIISRDHHDVSGTDSPFRETADLAAPGPGVGAGVQSGGTKTGAGNAAATDGSAVCADMAVQNALGLAARGGVTWLALHNGGGVGWGRAVNGGFGALLDGSEAAGVATTRALAWDVGNGVARRAWAGKEAAQEAAQEAAKADNETQLTRPHRVRNEAWLESMASIVGATAVTTPDK